MVAKWENDGKCFSRKNQYKGSLPDKNNLLYQKKF